MAESASLSQACVRAAQISAGAPLTARITVICCHSCEQRQNPKRYTVRTEFLRLTGGLSDHQRARVNQPPGVLVPFCARQKRSGCRAQSSSPASCDVRNTCTFPAALSVGLVFMYLLPVAGGSPETHVAGQEQNDANQQNDRQATGGEGLRRRRRWVWG